MEKPEIVRLIITVLVTLSRKFAKMARTLEKRYSTQKTAHPAIPAWVAQGPAATNPSTIELAPEPMSIPTAVVPTAVVPTAVVTAPAQETVEDIEKYYVKMFGEAMGPFTQKEIKNGFQAGEFPADATVSEGESGQWTPLEQFTSSRKPATPPPFRKVLPPPFRGKVA